MKIGSQTFGASFSVPETIFVPLAKWVLIYSLYMLPAHAHVMYGTVEKMKVMVATTHKERAPASASFCTMLFLVFILLTSGVVGIWGSDPGPNQDVVHSCHTVFHLICW